MNIILLLVTNFQYREKYFVSLTNLCIRKYSVLLIGNWLFLVDGEVADFCLHLNNLADSFSSKTVLVCFFTFLYLYVYYFIYCFI